MDINDDFQEILDYAHNWNWVPDWEIVKEIYQNIPNSYSVLTPFAYSYLEELIRSTTTQYGKEFLDEKGKPKRRKVGLGLLKLAKEENSKNTDYIAILDELEKYFEESTDLDCGNNRYSVDHGYMHPRFWTKESFENLIHDIAQISKYSKF
jgi:hypothetical protein